MRPTLQLTALRSWRSLRSWPGRARFGERSPTANSSVRFQGRICTSSAPPGERLRTGEGSFGLSVSPGAHTLQVTFIGYQSVRRAVEIAAGDTVEVDFELVERTLTGDEVVVVGSRTVRTVLETPAPVDVLSESEIRQSGETEINQTLRQLAPSFNASHQTISDGTDHINPSSLRGLGPDQVLVLVNGKRRHSSALVHVNGTFGRSTVGVDLSAIPKAAVERIEILRDGAAAQYGSDAIAGVINIVLKENTESLQLNSLMGTTGEGDGDQVKTDVTTVLHLRTGASST